MEQHMPDITPQHTSVLESDDLTAQFAEAALPVLLLCGAGPLALEVAKIAEQTNFIVDIVDTDAERANEELFPTARACFVVPQFADLVEQCAIDSDHYIAILTPEARHSLHILQQVLHTPARYIGLAGKREKRAPLFAALREEGMPTTELACIRCPIGLPIGASAPAELAIAIMAELIAAREGCLPRAALSPTFPLSSTFSDSSASPIPEKA